MVGRLEGEQGVKRGENSEDARCWSRGGSREYGSFELMIAVGRLKTPREGQRRHDERSRGRSRRWGDSGNTLRKSENPGVDGLAA